MFTLKYNFLRQNLIKTKKLQPYSLNYIYIYISWCFFLLGVFFPSIFSLYFNSYKVTTLLINK